METVQVQLPLPLAQRIRQLAFPNEALDRVVAEAIQQGLANRQEEQADREKVLKTLRDAGLIKEIPLNEYSGGISFLLFCFLSIFSLRPRPRLPIPAVFFQFVQQIGIERTGVAGGEIGFHVFEAAHAGNDRTHRRFGENEAQRHLRHRHAAGNQRSQRFGAVDAGVQIFRNKIGVAPVAFRPVTFFCQRAGQRAFVKRHARDDGDVMLAARRKKLVLRILIENIAYNLLFILASIRICVMQRVIAQRFENATVAARPVARRRGLP